MTDFSEKLTISKYWYESEIAILERRRASFEKKYKGTTDPHDKGLYGGWRDATGLALEAMKRLEPEEVVT
jgi:hypothetical protein